MPVYLKNGNRIVGLELLGSETMWSFPPCLESTAEMKTLRWIIHVDEQMEKCRVINQREKSLSEARRLVEADLGIMSRFISSILPDRRRKEGLIHNRQAENPYARRLGFMNLMKDDICCGPTIHVKKAWTEDDTKKKGGQF